MVATVTREISNTAISMRRGLAQGGTSSPPLFKLLINDMPKQLRAVLREKFPSAILRDPTILVAGDFISLATTLEEMQVIVDTFCEWAKSNGLNWNPLKSQFLRMITQLIESQESDSLIERIYESKESVVTNNKVVDFSSKADYQGLQVNTVKYFIFKNVTDLNKNGRTAVFMMMVQKWFSLILNPNFLDNF